MQRIRPLRQLAAQEPAGQTQEPVELPSVGGVVTRGRVGPGYNRRAGEGERDERAPAIAALKRQEKWVEQVIDFFANDTPKNRAVEQR